MDIYNMNTNSSSENIIKDPFDVEYNTKRSIDQVENKEKTTNTNQVDISQVNHLLEFKKNTHLDLDKESSDELINTCNKRIKIDDWIVIIRINNNKDKIVITDTVIKQFSYFRNIVNNNKYIESKTKEIDLSNISIDILKIILQDKIVKIISKISQDNIIKIIETLDYLGYNYMSDEISTENTDEIDKSESNSFWNSLIRKLNRCEWFYNNEQVILKDLIDLSIKINYGYLLVYELIQYTKLKEVIFSKYGGQIIDKLYKKNEYYTIKIVYYLSEYIGLDINISMENICDFLCGLYNYEHFYDVITVIWQPTLWYVNEKRTIENFAYDSPHIICKENMIPIKLELYADNDTEGSCTTVNYTMETSKPNPDSSITSVTSLGVYCKPKYNNNNIFSCFTTTCKFFYKNINLGEASFDLSSDGIKAFCPIISGGPYKTGLLVTCRIDNNLKENKDEILDILQHNNNENRSLSNLKIGDLSVNVKIRFFPLRTLTLYILYQKSLSNDLDFITKFSFSLQQDVAEWLGTYLCILWIQITKQKDIFARKISNNKRNKKDNSCSSSDSCITLPSTPRSGHLNSNYFLNEDTIISTELSDIYDSLNDEEDKFRLNKEMNNYKDCYFISSTSKNISPIQLMSCWFKGVGKPHDNWCINNILSQLLTQEFIAKYFVDILKLIQDCNKWLDTESLANFRDKFIKFIDSADKSCTSVGGILFDWIRQSRF